jgi:DNA-directed RNA polymerase subunit RPC12/RpoP
MEFQDMRDNKKKTPTIGCPKCGAVNIQSSHDYLSYRCLTCGYLWPRELEKKKY